MSQDILINWSPQETRVAVVEQGAVQEVHLERTLERGLVGNIYLGKVSRVLPGMQSAFIDIGLDRAAFLHVADLMPNIQAKHAPSRPPEVEAPAGNGSAPKVLTPNPVLPIERQIFEGQALMVQVLKDPIGTKGARLSTQVSLAGRMLVYLPQDPHIGISQRIEDETERAQLRERLRENVRASELIEAVLPLVRLAAQLPTYNFDPGLAAMEIGGLLASAAMLPLAAAVVRQPGLKLNPPGTSRSEPRLKSPKAKSGAADKRGGKRKNGRSR